MQQSDLNGILLMNKPQGFTSHDVVAKLRGILHTRRDRSRRHTRPDGDRCSAGIRRRCDQGGRFCCSAG